MVNIISTLVIKDQAKFVIHFYKQHGKSVINDKFECWIHKDKTVNQFVLNISLYYNLDANLVYFKQTTSEWGSTSEKRIKDPIILVVDDNRLLSALGIIFGIPTEYHFELTMNGSETDCAQCYVRIHNKQTKKSESYKILKDKNTTVSQLYQHVYELCQHDDFNIDYFVLTFNFSQINNSTEKIETKLTEDDTRLLSEIGVVFGQEVKNYFEVSFENLSDNVDDEIVSCLPTQDQETESLYLKNSNQGRYFFFSKRLENWKFRKLIEYRGLVNQSWTCYLNSLLQALYMTPEFRNAVYHWKFDFNGNLDSSKSIPFQLQKLFLNLQTAPQSSVETKELTNSFGWNSIGTCQQQDIQELCRVLFEVLEHEFKNTSHVDLINQLYQGKLNDIVKCLECGVEKCRENTFLDIPLSIRPFNNNTNAYKSITEALQGFVQPELLDGSNQYYCDKCNKKCDAHKSLKFTKFPYILTMYLMRFDFDSKTLKRVKLNDKVMFPLLLNLNGFITNHKKSEENEDALIHEVFEDLLEPGTETDSSLGSDEGNQNEENDAGQHKSESKLSVSSNPENEQTGPYMYELYAIMMHAGNASTGHYYAYIKDFANNQWVCFNDKLVETISMDNHIELCFGGESVQENSNRHECNAYMLMYRQVDKRRNKNAMTVEEFPEHLKDLYNSMQQTFLENRQMREKEQTMFPVAVYCYVGCKLELKIFRYNRTTTVDHLKALAKSFFKVTKPCRLVIFDKMMDKVVDNLEDNSADTYVYKLTFSIPCVLLLQIIDDKGFLPTSENCNLLTEDNLATRLKNLCVAATSDESINECEDSLTDSKITTEDAIEDNQIKSPIFEHNPIKVDDHDTMDKNYKDEDEDNNYNKDEAEDNNNNNEE